MTKPSTFAKGWSFATFLLVAIFLVPTYGTAQSIDLELSLTSPNANAGVFENITITATITNNGSGTATGVNLKFPSFNSNLPVTGDPEESQGFFNNWWTGTGTWNVGTLAAGASATVDIGLFPLAENLDFYGEVSAATGTDTDSSPNNGISPNPNEDDEAVITINDTGGGNCDITILVNNNGCNDNGTPNNASDDYLDVSFAVEGQNASPNGYELTVSLSGTTTAAYGQSFTGQPLISALNGLNSGIFRITAVDLDNPNCTDEVEVLAPLPCSNGGGQCSIAANATNIQCSNNGTPNNSTDDMWSFDLNVNGTNTSNSYFANIGSQTFSGNYGENTSFGLFPISAGNITVILTDSTDPSCTTSVLVAAPAPCSNGSGQCQISVVNLEVTCFDNGTTDPLDDQMRLDMELTGTNNSMFYTGTIPGPNQYSSNTINNTYNLMKSIALYNIAEAEDFFNGGPISFTVSDSQDSNCTTQITFDIIPPCSGTGNNEVDLELSMSGSTANPTIYSTGTIEVTVINKGTVLATNVQVEVPSPVGFVYQGGNESSASQGSFNTGTQVWSALNLSPNESATLEINYFFLADPNSIANYAQVVNVGQTDSDSTPNNGTCCTPNEDDEAAFTFGGTVSSPDLTVSNFNENWPAPLQTNVEYPFTFDLNNIGAATVMGNYRVGVYLSTNGVLDGNDYLIGEIATGDTPVGTITAVPGLVEVPASVPNNSYFVLLVADDLNDISETNENNNIQVSNGTYQVGSVVSGCQITATVLDIQCQSNLTLNSGSDDTYTARILVEGSTDCFGSYKIDGEFGGNFGSPANFGKIAFVGPFPISGGNATVEITDSNGDGAIQVTLNAPAPCSNGVDPNECGFENTYPSLPTPFLNGGVVEITENGNGYDVINLGNTIGNSAFSYYDLSVDLAGTELSLNTTPRPSGTFRRAADGNFFAASSVSDTQIEISKVTPSGTVIWANTYTFDPGGPQSPPSVRSVIELPDGIAFLVSAFGPSDSGWILKTDNNGNTIFNNLIQQTSIISYSFDQLANNGDFIIYRESSGRVGHLIRVSAAGNFIFEESIIGDLVSNKFGNFAETPDGNFIYASYLNYPFAELEKLDAFTGERQWLIRLNDVFSPEDDLNFGRLGTAVATSDGGAVVGYPVSEIGGFPDSYEYGKVNGAGNLVWSRELPVSYEINAQIETSDGGILFTGTINDEFALVKTTSEGLLTPTCVGGGGQCSISASAINIFCDDQGTPDNPLDDKFGFDLLVTGSNTSSSYSATELGLGQQTGGLYDVANTYPETFFIQSGNVSFSIEDGNDSDCSTILTITSPAPCSNGGQCSISPSAINIFCDDQGTPDNPLDDKFGFDLDITGSNVGSGWTATELGLGQEVSGQYGAAFTYPELFFIQNGVSFSIVDNDDSNCSTIISVTPPATCSNGSGGIDLELAITNAPNSIAPWSNISVDYTITNSGTDPESSIRVSVPKPDGAQFQGGNEFSATKGTYNPYGNRRWIVGNLAAGESATLTLNYFILAATNPINLYGQVRNQNGMDVDSSPNNGMCCTAVEDDEASLVLTTSSPQQLIGGQNTNNALTNPAFLIGKLYPNPATNSLKIEINSSEESAAVLQIAGTSGSVAQQNDFNLVKGENTVELEVSDLPTGVYFLKIETESGVLVKRFLKQ